MATEVNEPKVVKAATTSSRSLRQEEIDSCWRYDFIENLEEYLGDAGSARFTVVTKSGKHHLVTVKKVFYPQFEFSVSGIGSWYCYKYSAWITFLENLWDKAYTFICFEGDFQYRLNKPTANPDAEPDTEVEAMEALPL